MQFSKNKKITKTRGVLSIKTTNAHHRKLSGGKREPRDLIGLSPSFSGFSVNIQYYICIYLGGVVDFSYKYFTEEEKRGS